MNKQCTGCVVSAGTHKPAEALHQQIAEPQAEAMRGNTAGGVRCHDADACAMGQLTCPTPVACGCAPAPQAVQAAAPQPPEAAPVQLPEPFTSLVRKKSWSPNCYEASPLSSAQDYGRQWADERINVYTEQQVRQLLAAHGIKVNQ